MASKYEKMVGQVVKGILVSDYKREERISKTGRKWFKYMVQINHTAWITTTKFNKMVSQSEPTMKESKPTKTKKGYWFYQGKWIGKREFNQLMKNDETAWFHWGLMLHMSHASYIARERAREVVDRHINSFNQFDNMNVYGNQIYDSVDEYYQDWFNYEMEHLDGWIESEFRFQFGVTTLPGEMVTAFKDVLRVTFIEEFTRPFKSYVVNHWSELQDRFRSAWNERHDEKWYQYWERTSFGHIDRNHNEYDDQFAGLDAKGCKKLHRKLSMVLHPDVQGGNQTEFIKMQQAYERQVQRVA